MTGELHDVMMHKRTKDITTTFAPLQSRLFIACKAPQNEILPAFQAPEVCDSFEVDACFDYTLNEKNSMVLDHASYTANCSDGRKVVCEDSCFIIRVDDKLRELLHSEHRGGQMVQPWLTANNPPPKDYIDLELNYSFDCEEVPEKDIELVMENPQLFKIELNGKKISNTLCGEWFDPCLKCLNIPAKYIVEGYNKLVLRGVYNVAQSGLEAIFLRGDFGVRGMRTMTALPPDLHVGDWCEQGLANYSGDVTYHYDFKLLPEGLDHKFMLEVPNFGGTAVGVSINGSPMQMLLSEPYVFELDNVKPDENRVDITVFGSRRNLCGPFYNKDRWPWWTGSGELKCYQVTERRLVPSGLLEAPEILVVE